MIIEETEGSDELSVESNGKFIFIESGIDSLCIDFKQARKLAAVLANYTCDAEMPE